MESTETGSKKEGFLDVVKGFLFLIVICAAASLIGFYMGRRVTPGNYESHISNIKDFELDNASLCLKPQKTYSRDFNVSYNSSYHLNFNLDNDAVFTQYKYVDLEVTYYNNYKQAIATREYHIPVKINPRETRTVSKDIAEIKNCSFIRWKVVGGDSVDEEDVFSQIKNYFNDLFS